MTGFEQAIIPSYATSQPPETHPFNRRLILVVVIVVVVIVVLSASIFILDDNHHHSPNLALISSSVVAGLANQNLFKNFHNGSGGSYVIAGGPNFNGTYLLNMTGHETLILNSTNSSTMPRVVFIQSIGFTSASSSLIFYDSYNKIVTGEYRHTNSSYTIIAQNVSYDGFNFSYFLLDHSYTILGQTNDYSLVAFGYSGSYAFMISDLNVKLSSAITLIHDEIQAMMG